MANILIVRSKRVDFRTRSDRLIREQEAWAKLYPDIVDAYLQWDVSNTVAPADGETVGGDYYSPITVFDIFGMFQYSYHKIQIEQRFCLDNRSHQFPLRAGSYFITTMVRHGYMGNSPYNPSCAFSLQLLELFRGLNARCAQLSIHRFTRGLSDLQQVCACRLLTDL